MVVTIDSKFYSKLQLGISKYQEKTPADPLKVMLAGNSPGENLEFWAPEQSLCVEQSHEKLPATVPLKCPE